MSYCKTNGVLLRTKNCFSVNNSWGKLFVAIKRDKYLYMMLVPFVLFYLIFLYRPMLGLQIAFKDYNLFKGIEASPWVGLENFKLFFSGPYFKRILKNTLIINVYSLIFSFPTPIIFAIMFNELKNSKYKTTMQTITYFPHFISTVIVAGIVTNFLSPSTGIINNIIEALGGERTYFLSKPEYFRAIYVLMNMWKETGFSTIIYVAALTGIDIELYEAARIDGAGRWRQVFNITLPGILPTIIIMLILRLGSIFKTGYESIILLYQPSTYETADVISTYVYREGLLLGNYKLAAAVGLFDSIISLILTCITNGVCRRISETSLW